MRNNRRRYHYEAELDQTRLCVLLRLIEETDELRAYDVRNKAIYAAMGLAATIGLKTGINYDPQEMADWPVVFIELPTGQVSWHVPAHEVPWDGHTIEEKYERAHKYIDTVFQRPPQQGESRARRVQGNNGKLANRAGERRG